MRQTRREMVVAGGAAAALGAAPARPRRVVSLNPCLDEVLVQVADRDQIAALSHYARDPQGSTIAALARTFPLTHETAEEVMVMRPDLVLASRHTGLATREALKRSGAPLELFDVPDTVAASLDDVQRVARLVGHPERGAALVARIHAALAAAAPPTGARPVPALVLEPRGLAAGDGVLVAELLRRTGFASAGARYGVRSWGSVSLEQLLADPPEVLFAAQAATGAPTGAERAISHPALRAVAGRMRRVVFPERLLYCGGPTILESAPLLAAARRQVEAGR